MVAQAWREMFNELLESRGMGLNDAVRILSKQDRLFAVGVLLLLWALSMMLFK